MPHELDKTAPMAVAISLIHRDQIAAAVELFRVQLQEHGVTADSPAIHRTLAEITNDDRRGFVLVAATNDSRLVGVMLACAFLGLEHGGPSGWLEELYVLPNWRLHGIGTRLISETISHARKLGWRALDLEVQADHQRVIELYAKKGFQPLDRSRFCLKLD